MYCYFNGIEEGNRSFTINELDRILGNKKADFCEPIKNNFCLNFELHFSKTFQEQFEQAVAKIQKNSNCSNFDEALIYYGSIANHLRKIVVNNADVKKRICTKSKILEIINKNRKTVFDSAYRIYKGKQQYITEIKRHHFTYRNIDNWARFLIVELSNTEDISAIKNTILAIKNKFYKKLKRGVKSGAPFVYILNISKEILKRLKTDLIAENNIIKDGYDFMDADFQLKSLKEKSTIENGISIKFINNKANFEEVLNCDLECTKKIYQFYRTTPLDLLFDIDTVNIKISDLSEIQQILK